MDLRHFLFEHAITQMAVVKAMPIKKRVSNALVSQIVNKKKKPTQKALNSIYLGLMSLSVPTFVIDSIDEFRTFLKPVETKKPRKKPTAKTTSVGAN